MVRDVAVKGLVARCGSVTLLSMATREGASMMCPVHGGKKGNRVEYDFNEYGRGREGGCGSEMWPRDVASLLAYRHNWGHDPRRRTCQFE